MLSLLCPAKVNLFLEVTDKRQDGYHNLESIFLAVDLADRLLAEVRDGEITLECDCPGVPEDDSNLVVRAAEALRRAAGVRKGLHFRLEKRVPPGSGLGGGSSNAAAALRLADRLWGTKRPFHELAALAAGVGSDVPFFLHGGACLCRGRGEIIDRLPPFPAGVGLVLVLPPMQSCTAHAYRALRLPEPGSARRADAFVAAMRHGDVRAMASLAFNRFEETVFQALPELGVLHARLAGAGLMPRLSGSGAGLWIFGGEEERRRAEEVLKDVKCEVRIESVKAFLGD